MYTPMFKISYAELVSFELWMVHDLLAILAPGEETESKGFHGLFSVIKKNMFFTKV